MSLLLLLFLVVALTGCKIETVSQHSERVSSENEDKEESTADDISVSVTIKCDNLNGKTDIKSNVTIPEDGIILDNIMTDVEDGTTVYSVLKKVCDSNEISLVCSGSERKQTIYIISIADIAEKICGDKSGWMFSVNGEEPSVGASAYEVKDGDVILWYYVTN